MDYRKFLQPVGDAGETIVLPYFGGTRVDAASRWYRVASDTPPPIGWWSFAISNRDATPVARAEPTDLSALPALRGHYSHGWVIASGTEEARIALPPDEDPAPLSKVTLRRWYSGEWLFDAVDFEDDAETAARTALEERRPLGDVKGVAPSLRTAFGYALGMEAARDLEIPMTVTELAPIVVMIADGGVDVVRQLFDELVEQRRIAIERARLAEEERVRREATAGIVASARVKQRAKSPRDRVDNALSSAHARMMSFRAISNGAIDVAYDVDGNRIMSIVDGDSLQVIDPGICLSGAHRVLTLDAMPSVVREAVRARHLNITRR